MPYMAREDDLLTAFLLQLTPYVSYRVTHEAATRDKHTAAELFKETYEVDILKSKKHDAS